MTVFNRRKPKGLRRFFYCFFEIKTAFLFENCYSFLLLPLGFQKFFVKNIQKTKNGLRIICYAPHPSPVGDTKPPRGKAISKATSKTIKNKLRPLIENF